MIIESNFYQMDSKTFIENSLIVQSIIEQILYEGGTDNFVIFGLGSDYYVQLTASKGAYEIYCEAISNNYLEAELMLTQEQKNYLHHLSWNPPKGSDENYYLKHKVDSELDRAELAALILNTATLAYNCKTINFDSIVLNLQ